MNRRSLFSFLATLLLNPGYVARAQSPAKISRIGYLTSGPSPFGLNELLQGLQELGYIDGKNILVEARYGGVGSEQRQLELAEELVRLKVDVIVTTATSSSVAAKRATSTIPIVGGLGGDPIAAALVANLARPGGNITGVTTINAALGRKRLELLKEIAPKGSPVAVLWFPVAGSGNMAQMKELEIAARSLSLDLQPTAVQGPDFGSAFSAMQRGGAKSLIVIGSPMFHAHRVQIAELAAKSRLPAIYSLSDYVDAGGLMSYGSSQADMFRDIARYVDRILKGGRPAEMPVETPTKFKMVINLRTANEIGVTIPRSVLVRADRVIR